MYKSRLKLSNELEVNMMLIVSDNSLLLIIAELTHVPYSTKRNCKNRFGFKKKCEDIFERKSRALVIQFDSI